MKEYKLLREERQKIRREFKNEQVESEHGNNYEVTLEQINERMIEVEKLCREVEHKLQGDDIEWFHKYEMNEKKPFIVECPTCLKKTDVSEFLPQLGTFDETECCCVHCDNTFILWDNEIEKDDE